MCDEPGVYNEKDLRDLESNLEEDITLVRNMRYKTKEKATSWKCILDLGSGFTRTLENESPHPFASVPISRRLLAKFFSNVNYLTSAEFVMLEFKNVGIDKPNKTAFYKLME